LHEEACFPGFCDNYFCIIFQDKCLPLLTENGTVHAYQLCCHHSFYMHELHVAFVCSLLLILSKNFTLSRVRFCKHSCFPAHRVLLPLGLGAAAVTILIILPLLGIISVCFMNSAIMHYLIEKWTWDLESAQRF